MCSRVPQSRSTRGPGDAVRVVQSGFVGLLREEIMSELDSGREPCPAGCGHEAEAALRESAAGEAQSGLLDCPEAPPAGCAAAPGRQGGWHGMLRARAAAQSRGS